MTRLIILRPKLLFIVLLSVFGLGSCSTDVILYEDYQDIPVVYGFINVDADTNYIKITKAFCSNNDDPINPFEAAMVYDSSNYPGKLDVFIDEMKSVHGEPFQYTGRRFFLDTVTIHNKKEGLFYSPHQKLYYTTERFNSNQGNDKYRYQLSIVTPEYDTVTAETGVVSGNISLATSEMFFTSEPTQNSSSLIFAPIDEAIVYEFAMQFHYREVHPGQPPVDKDVTWTYGMKTLDGYERLVGDYYKLYFPRNTLFDVLRDAIGNDTVWDSNHPNVMRYVGDFYVLVSAAGEDFYTFYQFVQSINHSLNQSVEYSNVHGGHGLFSSRVFLKKKVKLAPKTKHNLLSYHGWGFQEE